MSIVESIILGAIQGLTEFLPVSSSGHLVLAQKLLGVTLPGVSFEVIVHLGTLLSVIVYFRHRVWRLLQSIYRPELQVERRMLLMLVVGTIPAGLAGFLFNDFFELLFSSPAVTSAMLIVTGFILLSSKLAGGRKRPLGIPAAVVIGLAQTLAIVPGISRSGSTITAGMLFGLSSEEAAEFSFLLALPVIAGAAVLKISDLMAIGVSDLSGYFVGALTSFLFGLLAVYLVLSLIRRGRFEFFAYYCFAAGGVGLYLFR